MDYKNATRQELIDSGFWNWDWELILIPASMHKTFPRDIEVTCIDWTKCMPDKMDNDERFWMLAYWIYPIK